MNKFTSTLLLVLVISALGAWGIWSPEAQPAERVCATSEASSPDAKNHTQSAPANTANPPIGTPPDISRQDADRTSIRAGSARELPFRIQVASEDGISPVANAEVFFIRNAPDQFASAYAAARVNVGIDPSVLAKPEDIFRTNADGFVNLPAPVIQTQIIARSGSRYGQLLSASSRQALSLGSVAHTLSIHEDPLFSITVLDVDGNPVADKAVALFRKSSTSWVASLLAKTNELGVATFFGMRSHLFYGADGEYGFGFDTPGLAPGIGPLAFEDLPRSAQLTTTQTASLRIHFFDRFGEDYRGNAWMQLIPTSTPFKSWHRRDLSPDGGSTIEFLEVEPGTIFDLKVGWEGQGSKVYPMNGPTQPGETVDVNITSEQERAILPVRLVAEDGHIFADVTVDLKLEVHERKIQKIRSYTARTNPAGEAVAIFPLTKRSAGRRKSTADYVAVFTCTDPQSGSLLQGELHLGPTPDPILHEQVDIVLKTAPILAAGYVRTADGQPAVHALISYGMVNVFTDDKGHFVLNTPIKPPFKTLSASWRQRRLRRIPFTFGAEDLEIVLENRDYLVEGQILMPNELRQKSFNLRFISEGKPRHISFVSIPRGQTSFVLELPTDQPGILQLLTESGRNVIASMHDLRPAAKDDTQDERLQPWHLREQIAFAEIEVQMNGKAVEYFRLINDSPGYRRKFTEVQLGNRILYVLSSGKPELARLDGGRYSGQEFRATSFMLKAGFQVVHVEPSITIFFAFPEEYELPAYAHIYVNLINSAGEEKWCEYMDSFVFEEEIEEFGTTAIRPKLTFQHAGVWSLTAKLSGTDAAGTKHSIPLPIGNLADGILLLSVQESSTGKEIHLDITQKDLDAAMEKAGWVFK